MATAGDCPCEKTPANLGSPESADDLHARSDFFDVNLANLSPEGATVVVAGWKFAEEVLGSEKLRKAIENKNDWTYPPSKVPLTGTKIAECIAARSSFDGSKPLRPVVEFYRSPRWGIDRCGGKSAGFLHQTASTGCTIDGKIYKNSRSLGDDPEGFGAFLAHEWLHAAGFEHGDNSGQCSAEKRNSVPIYIACAVTAHSDDELQRCQLSCD